MLFPKYLPEVAEDVIEHLKTCNQSSNLIMDTKDLEGLSDKDGELKKGKAHIIVELIEYEHNAVVTKSIMKKTTGSINALSFASGEGLNEKISPFDTYAQIIDGSASLGVVW